MPTVGILQRLLSVREHAATVARRHDTLRTWEGIAQVLSRKMESERKYIERLEGECWVGAVHEQGLSSTQRGWKVSMGTVGGTNLACDGVSKAVWLSLSPSPLCPSSTHAPVPMYVRFWICS